MAGNDTSSYHDEIEQKEGAKDVVNPEGPIARSKAQALQEEMRSLMMTTFPMQETKQEATKSMHVITWQRWPCILKLGVKVANSPFHLPPTLMMTNTSFKPAHSISPAPFEVNPTNQPTNMCIEFPLAHPSHACFMQVAADGPNS